MARRKRAAGAALRRLRARAGQHVAGMSPAFVNVIVATFGLAKLALPNPSRPRCQRPPGYQPCPAVSLRRPPPSTRAEERPFRTPRPRTISAVVFDGAPCTTALWPSTSQPSPYAPRELLFDFTVHPTAFFLFCSDPALDLLGHPACSFGRIPLP